MTPASPSIDLQMKEDFRGFSGMFLVTPGGMAGRVGDCVRHEEAPESDTDDVIPRGFAVV